MGVSMHILLIRPTMASQSASSHEPTPKLRDKQQHSVHLATAHLRYAGPLIIPLAGSLFQVSVQFGLVWERLSVVSTNLRRPACLFLFPRDGLE